MIYMCTRCQTYKPRKDFSSNKARKSGVQNLCKPCWKEYRQHPLIKSYMKKYREADKPKRYERLGYGITPKEAEGIRKKQKNVCPICEKQKADKEFVVDHCHKKLVFRGIICRACNGKLGWYEQYKNSIETYLEVI